MINSSILEFENSRNPFDLRRDWMERCLSLATEYQTATELIRERAEQLEILGIPAIDSLHVACAEITNSDYFIACDDRLLKKSAHFKVKSISPVDFIQEVTGESL